MYSDGTRSTECGGRIFNRIHLRLATARQEERKDHTEGFFTTDFTDSTDGRLKGVMEMRSAGVLERGELENGNPEFARIVFVG
jgi:hypothetical protein